MIRKKITTRRGIFFKGAAKPPELFPFEILPAPPVVTIPLLQHRGPAARPCVSAGDPVARGQLIGRAEDSCSAPVHASVAGRVSGIDRYPYSSAPDAWCVTIENNGSDDFSSPIHYDKPLQESSADELLARLALSGIVDETGLPLDGMLARARQEEKVTTLIVSLLSTEPFLQAVDLLCAESAETLLKGSDLCRKILGAETCVIAVNQRKPANASALSAMLNQERFPGCSLLPISAKYPHQNPRLLLRDCTGVELPFSAPLTAAGCTVIGGEAAARVPEALVELRPCYERVVTVAGDAIASPKNLLVRIGTPVRALLEACGADFGAIQKLVVGGPLSGAAVRDFETPVTKSTTALLAFCTAFPAGSSNPCSKCRRCASVCPLRLDPARLMRQTMSREMASARASGILECIECGCCSYVCPSGINLVHWLQFGKKRSGAGESAPSGHEKVPA
ncbi:MAG: RnfABCDGE type electron transport complex subunit C [Chitinispirillaceae bacterium]|nr:RnfABCDGE type electron transport complex subunit C [Chitinispirillaceae bacterium]